MFNLTHSASSQAFYVSWKNDRHFTPFFLSFDDPQKRAAPGALVNWLALNRLPEMLFALVHFTRLTRSNVGSFFSGGGGTIFSLGGVHPYFFHSACTSAPLDHLYSG
jgi:hypothetical protein